MHADEVFEVLVYLIVLFTLVTCTTSTGGHFYARIDEVFFDQ